MKTRTQKTYERILKFFSDKISKSGCGTSLYYALTDYSELFDDECIKNMRNDILNSIENNQISFNNILRCPVLHLSNPINMWYGEIKELRIKRIIPLSIINRITEHHGAAEQAEPVCGSDELSQEALRQADIKYLSCIFACSEYIIKKMCDKDFKIACNLLNLLYLA